MLPPESRGEANGRAGCRKRRFRHVRGTSALHPIATEKRTRFYGGFVPKPEVGRTYSITSSASDSKVGGTVRPRALAVLRLMLSSNLVGNCTGRSPGFSPRRIRSIYAAALRDKSTIST